MSRSRLTETLNAAEYFSENGLLKSKKQAAAHIFFEHHSEFAHDSMHGNKNAMLKLIELANTNDPIFLSYITLFTNFRFNHEGGLSFIKKGRGNYFDKEYLADCLLDFETYKALSHKRNPNLDEIAILKKDLEKRNTNWRQALQRLIKWPSTDAPESFQSLHDIEWVTEGLLDHCGYHVGKKGKAPADRRVILSRIIKEELPRKNFKESYINQWGKPGTMGRLMKLASVIASLCKNAKRRQENFDAAIADWEADLKFLKLRYFDYSDKRINNTWKDRKIEVIRELYGVKV